MTSFDSESLDRDSLDQYFTPDWVADIGAGLVQRIAVSLFGNKKVRILEPCVGSGQLTRSLSRIGLHCDVTTVDIDPVFDPDVVSDYLEWSPAFDHVRPPPEYDIVFANFPYKKKVHGSMVEKALRQAHILIHLAKITFLEPVQQRQHLLPLVDKVLILPKRPRFLRPEGTYKGADFTTHAWFLMSRQNIQTQRIEYAELPQHLQ